MENQLAALAGASVAFGVFDGIHLGHRYLIDQAISTAGPGEAVVLTFDRDPDELFRAASLRKLMSNEARLEGLAACGAQQVVALTFTPEFAALSPDDFLDHAFGSNVPAHLHVGADFRFGAKAAGTVADLETWGSAHNMQVHAHKLHTVEGNPVTATRIRELLAQGKVEDAAKLLGRPYTLIGPVVSGRQQGREMGIRTANVGAPDQLRAIGDGVYAAYALVDGKRYKTAVSVGVPVTFEELTEVTCEAHLIDFDGDLYDKVIALEFITWLRPMIKFSSTDELIATVTGNINWVRENL